MENLSSDVVCDSLVSKIYGAVMSGYRELGSTDQRRSRSDDLKLYSLLYTNKISFITTKFQNDSSHLRVKYY